MISSDTKVKSFNLAKLVIKFILPWIISFLFLLAFLKIRFILELGGIFFSTLKDLIDDIILITRSIELFNGNLLKIGSGQVEEIANFEDLKDFLKFLQ